MKAIVAEISRVISRIIATGIVGIGLAGTALPMKQPNDRKWKRRKPPRLWWSVRPRLSPKRKLRQRLKRPAPAGAAPARPIQ
ncbi:hypothetical protein TomTYG75_14030 [Sphingobium sp. TomTYG75]